MANLDRGLRPVLELERVVSTTLPRVPCATPWNLVLGPGLHALVGSADMALYSLAPLVSGMLAPRTGSVRVCGRDPYGTPSFRARIGVSLFEPELPAGRDVITIIDLVQRARLGSFASSPPSELQPPLGPATSSATQPAPGPVITPEPQPPPGPVITPEPQLPEHLLRAFGLEHWAHRSLRSLTASELRVLDLVLALSTPQPIALVLTEPGMGTDVLNRDMLRRCLSRAAELGACVVVVTASIRDALDLAHVIHLYEEGRVVRSVLADQSGELTPGCAVELRVEAEPARSLVERLAQDPAVFGISWNEATRPTNLSVRGNDLDQLALALARAVLDTNANVRSITPASPGLDEVRAASAGLALAAYHAAYSAYSAYAAPWVEATRRANAPPSGSVKPGPIEPATSRGPTGGDPGAQR